MELVSLQGLVLGWILAECETGAGVTATEGQQQATPRKEGVTTREPKLLC